MEREEKIVMYNEGNFEPKPNKSNEIIMNLTDRNITLDYEVKVVN